MVTRTVTYKSKYLIMKRNFKFVMLSTFQFTPEPLLSLWFVITLAQGWSNYDLWATSSDSFLFGPHNYCENLSVTLLLIIYTSTCLPATASSTICSINVASNGICYTNYAFQVINKYLKALWWPLPSPCKTIATLIQSFGCEVCPSIPDLAIGLYWL
jgi:hypothetical protein